MNESRLSNELPGRPPSRSVTVTRTGAGWEVREEYQEQVVRSVTYSDWHRVERAMELFRRQRETTADSAEV
jgi:hypothetical protein